VTLAVLEMPDITLEKSVPALIVTTKLVGTMTVSNLESVISKITLIREGSVELNVFP
jgi:hypothetical protein